MRGVGRSRGSGVAVLIVAMTLAAAACSSGSPAKTVTVTVSRPSPTASSSASPTAPPTPPETTLPGTCDTLLPLLDVENATGLALSGATAFVVGVPEKDIGRLAYLNCRYGIPRGATGAAATPDVEIGISLYDSAAQAQQRLVGTISDYLSNGATHTAVTVSGHPGTLLTGGSGTGYDLPLLVVSSGPLTVAVSIEPSIAPASRRELVMAALAALALARAAG